MKKLLYILLFVPIALFGQSVEDFQIEFPNPEYTGIFVFPAGTLTSFADGQIMIYSNGLPVGPAEFIYSDGSAGVAAFDDGDNFANNGDELQFVILHNYETIVVAHVDPPLTYYENTFEIVNSEMISFYLLDGNPVVFGCTDAGYVEYDSLANIDDGSCILVITGCTDESAVNYDSNATINDGSCEYDIITQINQSFDAWNISINLQLGWNIIGYGCPQSKDLAEGLSNYTESIIIVKDNNGQAYLPEFGYNGIGDFTPGFGYQIKITEAIEGFSLCDWYVNDIPEDNIVSLQEEVAFLQAELNSIYGCTYSWACNYDETAALDDGSCEYPEQGYDCDGNLVQYQVGDLAEGGIVFYIDESGQHGLVAAMEDLEEDYEWGCWGVNINGALSTQIGSGYQNTIDIVNADCLLGGNPTSSSLFPGINAAEACFNYEYGGYSDWYLPSKDEFDLLFEIIGPSSNISGNLNAENYRVSTQLITSGPLIYKDSWVFRAPNTWDSAACRCFSYGVRPIRSF